MQFLSLVNHSAHVWNFRVTEENPRHPAPLNKFFEIEKFTLTIFSPFCPQECFPRNPETGLFKYAPDFDARIFDSHAYTFKLKLFEAFPDL